MKTTVTVVKGFKQVHGALNFAEYINITKFKLNKLYFLQVAFIRSDILIQVLNYFSILSGCYDNTVRIWTTTGAPLLTIPGHSAPVKCVRWLSGGKFLKAK